MKFLFSILFCFVLFSGFSQRGKDGSVTITATNTIVNLYTPLTSNASIGSKTLTVLNSASYNVGDLVFIIQMQGASVNAGKDSIYPDPNSSIPTNTTFGAVTNYNNSGNNEYAEISAIPNATSIVIDCGLKYNYDYLAKVQVIKVPRYFTLTISGAGSITCPSWNGSVGGVAIIETQSNCTLLSLPSFSVTGKGFRGGALERATTPGGNKFGSLKPSEGAYKGESIAGDTTRYKVYSAVFGRGSIANGGGGGCPENSGGGGGSNAGNLLTYDGAGNPSGYAAAWNLESAGFATHVSSGGGRGGYSFSSSNQNPLTLVPGALAWSGDKRRNVGGYGGHPLDYTSGKLFLGGGGGAGEENDVSGSAGANGGGIVYIICYGNLSGAGTIVADGGKGLNTGAVCNQNDGAGGGGGGGTIILNVNGSIALSAITALSAKGGDGGSSILVGCFFNTDAYGPGGGGGGGYIGVSGILPSNSVSGGLNGILFGNGCNIAANFPPNGATNGGAGSTGSILNYSLTASANQTVCTNQSFTATATSTEPGNTISWYNAITGGTSIATGTAYVSPGYPSVGTYTLFAGVCPGTYRQPIVITVNAGLTLSINSPTICSGQTTTLTASGATTYTWSSGPTTNSIIVSPMSTTVYTISGTAALCAGTKTTQVTVNAVPTVTVSNPTICSGNSVTLTAGGASTYSWSTGQTTNTILISPSSTTSYSVTGTLSLCSNTAISTVSVVVTPTISLASQTICAGQTATFTVVGATTYTWLPGSTTGSSYTIAPITSTIITVKGANGTCTTQTTASLTIGSGITIAVNSPTICSGQTTTLTASGATTYTWSSGPTTNSIIVSPISTTVYTISGTAALCAGTKTTQVTVNAVPTVTVTNPTICSGNSLTLTAGGASTYSWSTGQTTNTILISPTSTTSYSVTGTLSLCSNTAISTVSVVVTPTISLASQTICAGQTATFTGVGATTYTWLPGSTIGSSYTIAPITSTIITVKGANGTCTTQTTASLTIGSGITIAVNSPTICSGQTTTLTASGASTYSWSSGSTSNTITISPTTTTVYTITGSSGICLGSNTASVTVNSLPIMAFISPTICSCSQPTLNLSGVTSVTVSPLPLSIIGGTTVVCGSICSNTNYTVIGSNGTCLTTSVIPVEVNPTPTLTVNSSTICSGQTATLIASGASTYSWSNGSTTSNINLAPLTNTNYTVTGFNGICSSSAIGSVIVNTVTITNYSLTIPLCANQITTLNAGTSSATSFTWSNGPNTYSQNVSPSVTTTFTVIGNSGICPALFGVITLSINPVIADFVGINGPFVSQGSMLNLTNTSIGTVNYLWEFCDATSSLLSNQLFLAQDTGYCCIKLIADNVSCKDSITKCFNIISEAVVIIPNVFTPNGDSKNDLFTIKTIGVKSLNCIIFDRWGLKLFEWDGINGGWDGNTKNGVSSDGSYYFILEYIDYKDKTTKAKGYFQLFKN
jgi:gliding motility-associated-like protein